MTSRIRLLEGYAKDLTIFSYPNCDYDEMTPLEQEQIRKIRALMIKEMPLRQRLFDVVDLMAEKSNLFSSTELESLREDSKELLMSYYKLSNAIVSSVVERDTAQYRFDLAKKKVELQNSIWDVKEAERKYAKVAGNSYKESEITPKMEQDLKSIALELQYIVIEYKSCIEPQTQSGNGIFYKGVKK